MLASISIITICFNNLEELKATCTSVDKQTTLPVEHWIIDGSSNDEIRNYLAGNPQPSYRKWISEKDNGIADAFNKGVQMASGDILNMLNAADYYIDEKVLATVTAAFEKHLNLQWLHSKYKLERAGIWVTIGKPFEKNKLYRGMRSLSHQSMFVKAALHKKYGLYNTSLRNAMDYDFVCRIAAEPMMFIEKPLIVFAPGGTTYQHYLTGMQEARKVYEKYFGFSLLLLIWQLRLKLLHFIITSPVGQLLYKIKVWLRLENI